MVESEVGKGVSDLMESFDTNRRDQLVMLFECSQRAGAVEVWGGEYVGI